MPRLRKERSGQTLRISSREIRFSQWPTTQKGAAQVLQFEMLISSPWEIIKYAIIKERPDSTENHVLLSFLRQAHEFYKASQNFQISSRPLLLYYSLLNLAKAFILHRGIVADLNHAKHGISDDRLASGAREFFDAQVTIHPANPQTPNIFELFGRALGYPQITTKITLSVLNDILPQIVVGHRLWASAADSAERFLRIERIRQRQSSKRKEIWLTLDFQRSDLKERKLTHSGFLQLAGLGPAFHEVKARTSSDAARFCRLELKAPIQYTRRPSDVLAKLSNSVRPYIWPIIRSVPPYRRYYVYAAPAGTQRLHPILSVYAAIFYLGSVTRYRPHQFDAIATNDYGNLIHEIVDNQIHQLLFQLASEFKKREISSPAVI